MNSRSRRRFLSAGSTASTVAVAGCLGDALPTDEEAGAVEHAIVQYSTALGRPDWREDGRTGHLDAFGSEDQARESLDLEELSDDHRDEVEAFLAGTDFAETVLLFVASVGPNTCYNGIEVRELETDETTLTGVVAPVDTSDGDVDCGAAETHPSALIRPEFDGRPERVELTIVDGWDERGTIERAVG